MSTLYHELSVRRAVVAGCFVPATLFLDQVPLTHLRESCLRQIHVSKSGLEMIVDDDEFC